MRETLCYHVSLSSHMEFAREGRSLQFNTGSILSRGGSPRRLTELSVSRWLSANRSGKAYVPCSSIIPVVDEGINMRLICSMEAEMAGSSVLKQGSFDRGIRSITG
ncbi:hypothetical protein F2Q70_00014184 [Brassica cretica]|uniref:Uncharacterized protein n=1 Tax=Brassica cretica TaxID=69181 RepID=A0A8S9HSH0_BRACR|nr:hypothetical protein F2Q70_00014184 [Brassica cretica]